MKAAGIEKGSQTTGRGLVGQVTMDQIREIAEQKMPDLNATRHRGRRADDHGLGPLDGPRGGGVAPWQLESD